jgi:hypothetical protein
MKGAMSAKTPLLDSILAFTSPEDFLNRRRGMLALQSAVCLLALFFWSYPLPGYSPAGKTRAYYVAADEINWDYAPTGRDEAMGHSFDELQQGYTEPGPHHIGRIYKHHGHISDHMSAGMVARYRVTR